MRHEILGRHLSYLTYKEHVAATDLNIIFLISQNADWRPTRRPTMLSYATSTLAEYLKGKGKLIMASYLSRTASMNSMFQQLSSKLEDRLGFQNISKGRITTLLEYIQCKRNKKDQVQALVLEMGGSRTYGYGTVAPSTPPAIDIQK